MKSKNSIRNSSTMGHQFLPKEHKVLSHDIYDSIRDAILDGRLEPGERIVETAIAEQMGVSRAPLREALRQLERDGLLDVETHRETRVVSLGLDDIKELHLIRTVLETLAYQYAAQRLSNKDMAPFEILVENMEKAAQAGDANLLGQYDYEFHELLCKSSGWPRLYRIWSDQHVLLRLWFNVVAKSHDNKMIATATSHRFLLEAIKANDKNAIARQVYDHIYFSGPTYLKERARWANEAASSFEFRLNLDPEIQSNQLF